MVASYRMAGYKLLNRIVISCDEPNHSPGYQLCDELLIDLVQVLALVNIEIRM
jgi:hypothetical protein